jgi:hypothetical protein
MLPEAIVRLRAALEPDRVACASCLCLSVVSLLCLSLSSRIPLSRARLLCHHLLSLSLCVAEQC